MTQLSLNNLIINLELLNRQLELILELDSECLLGLENLLSTIHPCLKTDGAVMLSLDPHDTPRNLEDTKLQ